MPAEKAIAVVGDWRWPWYEEACCQGLEKIGWRVHRIAGSDPPLAGWRDDTFIGHRRSVLERLQGKLLIGRRIADFNARVVRAVSELKPAWLWIYNNQAIRPETLLECQRLSPDTKVAVYANDDPFRPTDPSRWRNFLGLVPLVDLCLAYRTANLSDFRAAGARRVSLLRSYFLPADAAAAFDFPDRVTDAAFVGHFEPDGRLASIECLMEAGLKVGVFGTGWSRVVGVKTPLLAKLPVQAAYGSRYRAVLRSTAIALCFLSKLNRDEYTRRNFEIPAMGTFMLSEYSEALGDLFIEGVEAEFFRDVDELVDKSLFYATRDPLRESIASRGRTRVLTSGHCVVQRMIELTNLLCSISRSN